MNSKVGFNILRGATAPIAVDDSEAQYCRDAGMVLCAECVHLEGIYCSHRRVHCIPSKWWRCDEFSGSDHRKL